MEDFIKQESKGGTPTAREFMQMQENVGLVLDEFVRRPENDTVLLEDEELTASTEKSINHGLGRTPRGWYIVDKDADANVYRSSASTSTQIKLTADANVTISLVVF